MSRYNEIGTINDYAVYSDKETGKIVVSFLAIKNAECNKPVQPYNDARMWAIRKSIRENNNALNIAKSAHKEAKGVNNRGFGGGISFNLTIEELRDLAII